MFFYLLLHMLRRWVLLASALLLSVFFTACTPTSDRSQADVPNPTADAIAKTAPQQSAKRVVSLSSIAADITAELDRSKLVGISGSRVLNSQEKFKDITRVSEGQNPPNLEKILELKPDLVIGAEGFSNQVVDKLNQLKVPTMLTKIDSWGSLENLTKTLAEKIAADPQPLLNRYKSFLPENSGKKPSTLVLVSRQPILTPNKSSWAGDLLERFNVNNLGAQLQGNSPIGGFVTLSAEKVLEANPEVLIIVDPQNPDPLKTLQKEAFWNKLQATKNNRVYVLDYYGFINAGSIESIQKACDTLKKITT